MNILFLLKNFSVGGVEVVTSVLANKFTEEKHHVVLWVFMKGEFSIEDRLNDDVKIVYGGGFTVSKENEKSLLNTLRDNKIDVVINQWALPPQTTSLLKKVVKQYPVHIISEYHSDPMTNGRLMNIESDWQKTTNPLIHCILGVKRFFYKYITSYSFRRCYQLSDKFVVLSESYKKHFTDFANVKDDGKLISIANPVTIDTHSDTNPEGKLKHILYVGRLECENKKPDRVLKVWSKIENNAPDWSLDIVGDGPDKERLEKLANDMQLKRCHFCGYQNPVSYYKQSQIMLLTSDFEGFPLVLVEAMSCGVIPVVYGSFSAADDIIDDGINGIVIPKGEQGFDAELMASNVKRLIDEADGDVFSKMSHAAVEKSKYYSLDKIYNLWMDVL